MNKEIEEYEKYLSKFVMVEKPTMPKIDLFAYTDNEYLSVVDELLKDYDKVDDEYLTIAYLKGEWCK